MTAPPVLDPLAVACHYCGAPAGEACTVPWSAIRDIRTDDGPHAHRLRAATAAHDGWEPGQQPSCPRSAWWGLGTPSQGILRHVAAAVRQGTAASYRPDTRSNPIYEWAAVRAGYYTWTPETGAELTPYGRALLADANRGQA